uniref:ISXO2-like transposase domain-containing protein n=1 Tax=Candidatus Kentrum sp. TUN TaxID=2126343 RepID=A0A450ZBI1_9GAMM|nr:MAG: hypothetical protein BECKTUN1418D_GA0071000_10065 [Candidatus Kentron sp. TUN]
MLRIKAYNSNYISLKHIDRYLSEFSFRLNQGNVKIHTLTRMVSLIKGIFGKRLTYKALIEK